MVKIKKSLGIRVKLLEEEYLKPLEKKGYVIEGSVTSGKWPYQPRYQVAVFKKEKTVKKGFFGSEEKITTKKAAVGRLSIEEDTWSSIDIYDPAVSRQMIALAKAWKKEFENSEMNIEEHYRGGP